MASLSGRLAQRIERLLHTQEVTGSNPVLPTIGIIPFSAPFVPRILGQYPLWRTALVTALDLNSEASYTWRE